MVEGEGAPTLLDRRAAQTRAEIYDAAVPLFLAQGFDATSMDEVAAAAGVSRRTLYRYFDTKDDIVFDAPRQWREVFETTLATRRDDEATRDVIRRALVDVADHVQEDAARVLAGFGVLSSSPSLAGRHGKSDAEWVQRLLQEIAPDTAEHPDGDFRATAAAMAIVAGQNAVMIHWAAAHPDRAAGDLMLAMLDQLDSVWPAPCRDPR